MVVDSECVTWRDFEKLEKTVEKLAESTHALQIENAEFRVLITNMGGKLDSMDSKMDVIADTVGKNKVSMAKVMAILVPIQTVLTVIVVAAVRAYIK